MSEGLGYQYNNMSPPVKNPMTKFDHFVNKFAALNRKRNLTAKELQQQAVKLWNDK